MLRICFVKNGSAYGADYCAILADMVSRNLAQGIEGTFECFTDDPSGLPEHINTHPIPDGFPGWWAKLVLFKDGLFDDGDRIVYIDLDTVILGPLDDIVKYDGPFAILRDFFKPHDDMQSAIMAWPANTQQAILDKWLELGRPELAGGDQELIQASLRSRNQPVDFWQGLFPGKFVSYKSGSFKRVPPKGAAVVCFHGQPKPHNCGSNWIDGVWKIDGSSAFEIEQYCNTEEKQIAANIAHALTLPYPRLQPQPENNMTAVIVGGAPSLKETWRDIVGIDDYDVFACNNTAKFLNERGIDVSYQVIVDARPENAEFLDPLACGYMLASQCDRAVFDKVGGVPTAIFHPKINGIVEATASDPTPPCIVGGGSTVCLKAIAIAYIMGYRKFHLFGMDSSLSGEQHHAYAQPQNDDDLVVQVQVDDKFFMTSPWMVAQSQEFEELLIELSRLGCTFDISGDGLIPYILREMTTTTCAKLRADAVLSHLPVGVPIRGAEIGVFAGEMSALLLRNPNLSLFMVDAWDSEAYAPGSDDFHAGLPKEAQDMYQQMAWENTQFARDRRTLLVCRSEEAAAHMQDASLDFVFIDADHSYEGCNRDLELWYPKVKDGGLFSGHDYDHPEYPSWGVKRAVDEFAALHGLVVSLGENMTWLITKPSALERAA